MSDVTTNIYDGAMTLLASGNRSAVYGGFPAAGYYYARVNSSTGATGFYYVEVTRITPDTYEPNDTPAQAAVVQIDEDCYVTLHSMADVDWMAFYIDTPGAPMRVEAYGVSSIYVEIYNSGLGLLTSGTSQVNWTFGSAGWYYARLAPMTSPTMGEFRVVFQ